MQDITYIGEHLFHGQFGHFLLILAFASAIFSAVSYYFATSGSSITPESRTWRNLGRVGFSLASLASIGSIGMIFYIMINHFYEYEYVWSHVSEQLPFKYIFTAFWEGQQGSFLLWIFWHAILGMILMWRGGKWEAPSLAVLAMIQAFLISMILGIYLTEEFRLGVTPFALLRESEGMSGLPVFANANYLELIEGKGLNPLLQNYWMIIHPPTLFLGFASVTIPFCYAVAGFWTKDYTGWLKAVMPWALFSGAILGTGIVMGGAWAYEALSFGGYWAWDPVENASLVPWLILIAGIHMNLVARRTGHSIKGTYVFYSLSFLFVLYSTFLTRSGILGDSSVHAFTEMGLEWQLVIFMVVFAVLTIVQYFRHRISVPVPEKEEAFNSREFWMFIGSLVLLFSAGLITFTTSLPVFNKLMDAYGSLVGQDMSSYHKASPEDPIAHYNRFQLWIAVFIGFLSGLAQYLYYKEKKWDQRKTQFWKNIGISAALSIVLTVAASLWINVNHYSYYLLLFSAIFGVVANLQYLITILKLKMKASAAVLSHVGFGLMILGVMASGLNKTYISNNSFAMRGIFAPSDDRLHQNVYLVKGEPMFMGGYLATYVSDTMIDHNRSYKIKFDKLAEDQKTIEESFELEPYLTYNMEKTEMVNPNPSTRRYAHKDIFSHIVAAPPKHISVEAARAEDDSLDYRTYHMIPGDTLTIQGASFKINDIILDPTHPEYTAEADDLSYGLEIMGWDSAGNTGIAKPVLAIKQQRYIYSFYDNIYNLGARIRLTEEGLSRIYPDDRLLSYETYQQKLGDEFYFEDYKITVDGFDRDPVHPSYLPKEGDIAVAVQLRIEPPTGDPVVSRPIFLIRDNRTFVIKDYAPSLGISTRFSSVDPTSERLELQIAKSDKKAIQIPVEIALDAPRDDYIVLEAIEFPGINFFWLGCILMMGGMLLGMARRFRLA